MSSPRVSVQEDHLLTDDRGAAVVLLSAMMVLLLGLAAFAVDLGWLWLNASRVQNAADAAALSGVTHLPANASQAHASAEAAARANGYPIGGVNSLASSTGPDNTLDVTLTTQVDTFFLRVLGQPTATIARQATAQYILPVPLGSPFNSLGDGSQNFWGSIAGKHMSREHGDPYATRCIVSDNHPPPGNPNDPLDPDTGCDVGPNPWRDPNGYYIGIEVAPGTTNLTIELWDPGYYEREDSDTGTGDSQVTGSFLGAENTRFKAFDADTTPYDTSDNLPHHSGCDQTYPGYNLDWSVSPPVHTTTPGWVDAWVTLCTIGSPTPGLHLVQVNTSGAGGNNNNYGIRATTTGPSAKVYGINSLGIYANVSGITTLYLAEVEPVHAGKTLKVNFFDAGEASGDPVLTIQNPAGGTPSACSWTTGDGSHSGSSCAIHTTPGGVRISNDDWIHAEIDIPDDYTCDPTTATGCWWTVEYDYSSGNAHDRTTWEIEVVGNPVRLVVDAP